MKKPEPVYLKKVKSFTLTEMLVVLCIIGILVFLMLPDFLASITKTKNVEAKIQLGYLHTLEQNYFYEHSKYSKDLAEIGFTQGKLVSEDKDGRANYRIEIINITSNTYTARATSVTDFDGDGTFNIWEINQDKTIKEITPD